jgi:hypothetical protein
MAEPLVWASLAIGGGGLGLSLIQERRMRNRDQRSLTIRCRPSFEVVGPHNVVGAITVIAVNDGHRPVEVASVGFEGENGERIPMLPIGDIPWPVLLTDGKSVEVPFDKDTFDRMLKQEGRRVAQAVVWDAAGARYAAPFPELPD